jgi:hypothetical protein
MRAAWMDDKQKPRGEPSAPAPECEPPGDAGGANNTVPRTPDVGSGAWIDTLKRILFEPIRMPGRRRARVWYKPYWIRQRLKHRATRWLGPLLFVLILLGGIGVMLLAASPWPPLTTLRHWAAYPNCDTARLVGLAEARVREPGYYFQHDRDGDGIACEPWEKR